MDKQQNIDGMKLSNKKLLTRLAVSSCLTDSGQLVIHTVMPACKDANINKVEDLALSQENEP